MKVVTKKSPTPSTVWRPTESDGVYKKIKTRVLDLIVAIDEPVRLREEDIAQELSVSRTPVREALRRLGQEGLLNLQPRRGAVLMPVTFKEYIDWLTIRAELESFAAAGAAFNATKHDVNQMRSIFAEFSDDNLNNSIEKYASANVIFHAHLIDLANNLILKKIWSSFGHHQMLRFKTIRRLNRSKKSLSEHLKIIDAIDARDAKLASQLAKEHVLSLLKQVEGVDQKVDNIKDLQAMR